MRSLANKKASHKKKNNGNHQHHRKDRCDENAIASVLAALFFKSHESFLSQLDC